MVGPEPRGQVGENLGEALAHPAAGLHLHPVALAVVEAHRLDPAVALERPGQADGGVLAAGEEHEGGGVGVELGQAHAGS